MRKIRELGSLPTDAFEKYMGLTLSQVRGQQYRRLSRAGLPTSVDQNLEILMLEAIWLKKNKCFKSGCN